VEARRPGGLRPRALLGRLWRALDAHAVTDTAAQLSYYLLFSLFPFLFFLVTLAAFLPIDGLVQDLVERARPFVPAQALEIVEGHLGRLLGATRPRLLTLGLAATLWTASRGTDALRKGLNLAYDVRETRSFWRAQGTSILLTVLEALLVLVSFAMIALGGEAGHALAAWAGVDASWATLWTWARWPITAAVVMFGAALAYYALPDVEQRFRYVTPGSVVATLLWIAATFGFTQYVAHFGNYEVTYGSIGGALVLLTWLWISSLALLLGAELNAVLEHATRGGKRAGARVFGARPEPKAARPSAAPPGAVKSPSGAEGPEEAHDAP
jgi:membrane protein